MDSKLAANASLDDIVFQGRNKAYGAYLLRKLYNSHITKAAIIATLLFLLFVSIPLIAKLVEGEEEAEVVERIVTEVELAPPPPIDEAAPPPPPPPPPPDLPPPPPPVRATVKYTPPVVKRDEEVQVEEEIPDVEVLQEIDAGVKTIEGSKDAPVDLGEIDGTSEVVAEVVEEKPYTYVEQMPSFPGGETEMLKYLAKNIRYPAAAQRAGVEGLVVLSFVVSKTGEISEIQVIKNLGAGTDEEATRVVKTMPKWTPGKQNGRAVPVRYTLPVRFTIK
ncbi:outer membrane transport energization protein TonB [Pontibacter ummariensis]|uniref:Outer membrane transport energization protein TonB n=1 Tax=Pontibacter ummariensis TaxID=1610492 RepID=A0A239JI12_9BACT|nr:energy transducer TonB [Pontibacter ummariensis]PRY07815.1 outer membrane transport energization protein TonB [Pontibacter ummariensis]SNT05212.1 outer membrane transport energization protein TonB [Pontibacter ummariensis]